MDRCRPRGPGRMMRASLGCGRDARAFTSPVTTIARQAFPTIIRPTDAIILGSRGRWRVPALGDGVMTNPCARRAIRSKGSRCPELPASSRRLSTLFGLRGRLDRALIEREIAQADRLPVEIPRAARTSALAGSDAPGPSWWLGARKPSSRALRASRPGQKTPAGFFPRTDPGSAACADSLLPEPPSAPPHPRRVRGVRSRR